MLEPLTTEFLKSICNSTIWSMFNLENFHTFHQHREPPSANQKEYLLATQVWYLSSLPQLYDPHCSFHNTDPTLDLYKPIKSNVKKKGRMVAWWIQMQQVSDNLKKILEATVWICTKYVNYRNAWSKDIRNPGSSDFKSSCSTNLLHQLRISAYQ